MTTLNVTKMHALGNNYIYIDTFDTQLHQEELPALARAVSDVRRGIGSDGLILIGPSERAAAEMRIFNADGSEAENCGNGLRCVAKYVYEHGLSTTETFDLEIQTGVVRAQVHPVDGCVQQVTVDMGLATFGAEAVNFTGPWDAASAKATVETAQGSFTGMLVSMGNPHFVMFTDDANHAPLSTVGPEIEQSPWFRHRVNVEWVSQKSRSEIDFRVWERGSGITFACGTGACAAVAAGIRQGLLDRNVTVHLMGGDLQISERAGRIWMTGEAVEVLQGQYVWSTPQE
jgi:diaminopimelate epimerase